MNRTILEKALNKLHERKITAERISDENYKIALQNPDIYSLDKQMRSLTIEISKKEFWGKDSTADKSLMKELSDERDALIEKNFGKDFSISPNYSCKECNDSGFVNMVPCSCMKKLVSEILLDLSGTARNLATFDKANFNIFEGKEKDEIQLTYKKMEEWCNKVGSSKYKNIGLFGNTGVGKTFLTEAMANDLIKNGHVVMITSAFNLNNILAKYHTCIDATKPTIIAPYLDCEVLIIDDLGSEPILKNVTLEYLYLIINERINSGKSTVFSTNLASDKFRDRYGERISSRLTNKENSLLIHFSGEDLRTKKQ